MVPILARMAVIIKADHDTSTMTGNYEFGYACGLLYRLTGMLPPSFESPAKLWTKTMEAVEQYTPADEREANMIRMLKYYKPDATMDDQVLELFQMGLHESNLWKKQ